MNGGEGKLYGNGNPCMIALDIANPPLDCLSSGSGPAGTIFNIYNYFLELLCI